MRNVKRGQLQISFGWLFAIIVGIFILAVAFYIAVKFAGIGQTQVDTETSKYLGILLNPYEIGAESEGSSSIPTPVETRIYATCEDNFGAANFGEQSIQTSQMSFGKWSDVNGGVKVSFQNKYIFSENVVEGKEFLIFIQPFNFPFKVADMIILTSSLKNYCFVNPTDEIESDLKNLGQKNLGIYPDCERGSVKVCFERNDADCDMGVYYENDNDGYVEKNNERFYFENELVYGAIFSDDKEVYECQVKRLMKRLSVLSTLYESKSQFLSQKGCTNNLETDLAELSRLTEDASKSNSEDVINPLISQKVRDIQDKNGDNVYCKLW